MRHLCLALAIAVVAASSSGCSGGSASAQRVATVDDLVTGIDILGLTSFDGLTLFAAIDPPNSASSTMRPWVSDGTPEGTQALNATIERLRGDSDGEFFFVVENFAYFIAVDDTNGSCLWRTDGTPSGTTLEATLVPLPLELWVNSVVLTGNQLFVSGYSWNPATGTDYTYHLFSVTLD